MTRSSMLEAQDWGADSSAFSVQRSAFSMMLLLLLVMGLATPAFAALELTTDHRSLAFGLMEGGDEKTLTQTGGEVTCLSTGGRTWYLKVHLLRPLTSGAGDISPEQLSWQVVRVDGTGTVASSSDFRSFSLFPDLVYISGSGEGAGQPVRFQLRYRLQIPEAQPSGSYQAAIRFTLTEVY